MSKTSLCHWKTGDGTVFSTTCGEAFRMLGAPPSWTACKYCSKPFIIHSAGARGDDSLQLGLRLARFTFPDGTKKDVLQQAWVTDGEIQWCDVPVHHVPYEAPK